MFADGALGSQTGLCFNKYRGSKNSYGIEVTPPRTMLRYARAAAKLGLPSAIHAIGDRAISQVLDVLEQVPELKSGGQHRIEHLQLIRRKDIRSESHLLLDDEGSPDIELGQETIGEGSQGIVGSNHAQVAIGPGRHEDSLVLVDTATGDREGGRQGVDDGEGLAPQDATSGSRVPATVAQVDLGYGRR